MKLNPLAEWTEDEVWDYIKENIVGYDFVTAYGGRIETIPLVAGRSTTGLIEALVARKPDTDGSLPRG